MKDINIYSIYCILYICSKLHLHVKTSFPKHPLRLDSTVSFVATVTLATTVLRPFRALAH